MSFKSIAICAEDRAIAERTKAAYAKQGVIGADNAWAQMRWAVSADPSIEAPYESALAGGNLDPGGDESVITDAALTAAVQANPYPPTP